MHVMQVPRGGGHRWPGGPHSEHPCRGTYICMSDDDALSVIVCAGTTTSDPASPISLRGARPGAGLLMICVWVEITQVVVVQCSALGDAVPWGKSGDPPPSLFCGPEGRRPYGVGAWPRLQHCWSVRCSVCVCVQLIPALKAGREGGREEERGFECAQSASYRHARPAHLPAVGT